MTKWLSKKVMEADAIVVDSSTFYGAASAFTNEPDVMEEAGRLGKLIKERF
ncbi:MAG TPA: hypothetical protein VIO11_10735 [Candidatus Methanoperedens sp.]